ncbi:MAG: hypothetical protein FJY65_08830 [Calditrichaeota bacterium]|nr:hypothetical protein [Calditrichota bacterium]
MHIPYRFIGSFKAALFALAVAILFGVLLYTNRLVNDLRETSRRYLTLKVERYKQLFSQGDDAALEAYLTEMTTKDFPLIVADVNRLPISWSGLPELEALPDDAAKTRALEYQKAWLKSGNEPVAIDIPEFGLVYYFYYGDTPQIRRLRYLPWIELVLVGGLIFIGYIGFVNIKKSEERSVWVGMARETAHQLGTPLTSLFGWLELLSESSEVDVCSRTSLQSEMKRDLERLRSVAERFNQIGSTAALTPIRLKSIVAGAAEYVQRRVPGAAGRQIQIVVDMSDELTAKINPTLFEWVVENLVKNGAEAMKGKTGAVIIRGEQKNKKIIVDVSDEGAGVQRRYWKDMFRPGWTTKPRGWGLGLSLARRIICDIHRGRIFFIESSIDKGTTIRMILNAG